MDPTQIQQYLNQAQTYEVEVRIGSKINNSFQPGIPKYQFDLLFQKLKDNNYTYTQTLFEDTYFHKTSIRKRHNLNTNETIYIKKNNVKNIDFDSFRFSVSSEKIIKEKLDKLQPKFSVLKLRYSFTDLNRNFRYDLSVILDPKTRNPKKFEVEMEILQPISFNTFLDALKIFTFDQQPDQIKQIWNTQFGRQSKNLFNPQTKPRNLKREDIPSLNQYAVKVKYDGVNRFLYITHLGAFLIQPPYKIIKVADVTPNNYKLFELFRGTVIEGEWMEQYQTFIGFDLLMFPENNKIVDLRSLPFHTRYKKLDDNKSKLNDLLENTNINFEISKVFYNPATNIQEVLKYMQETKYENDGIIFTPIHKGYKSDILKWKPENMLTIDFKIGKINNNQIDLLVYDSNNSDVLFAQTNIEDFPFKTGQIVEFRWDGEKFIPIRLRVDKIKPNFIEVAKSIFQDIKNPIQVYELTQDLIKKYFEFVEGCMVSTLPKLVYFPLKKYAKQNKPVILSSMINTNHVFRSETDKLFAVLNSLESDSFFIGVMLDGESLQQFLKQNQNFQVDGMTYQYIDQNKYRVDQQIYQYANFDVMIDQMQLSGFELEATHLLTNPLGYLNESRQQYFKNFRYFVFRKK